MDAYDDDWKDSDEEFEAEEESSKEPRFKPSYILVALDTDASMFVADKSGHSSFIYCLNACYQVASSLVMADKGLIKGPLGIVLAENEPNRAKFVDFQDPIPDTIKLLGDLKNQTNQELKAKYQRKTDFDLADFFLLCKNKLTAINAEVYKRIVLYITNDDNPVKNDARKRFKVINESQKFANIHVDLKVISFKSNFDSENLYSEVLSASNSSSVECINSVNLSEKISELVQKKHFKVKAKFYPFRGDTERYFEIVLHRNIRNSYIAKNMYVTRDTQKEVKKSVIKKENTGNYLIKYAKKEPELKITEREKEYFTETNLPIGYSLLYVGKETVKPGWVIESPLLMEKRFEESQPIFEIFWEFCREKSKCLFCLRKFKKCGKIRVVQLVPKYVNDSRMFMVKVMPYRREVHFAPRQMQEIAYTKQQETAVTALVDTMTFNFNPSDFVDPVLGKKAAYIKSQLLNEPMEKISDGARSDLYLDELISKEVQQLHKLNLVDEAQPTGGKRKPAKTETDQRKKKATKK